METKSINNTGIYDKFFIELKNNYNITLEQFKDYDFQKCGKLVWNYEGEHYELDDYFSHYFSDKQIIQLLPRIKEIILKISRCICKVNIVHISLLYSKSQDILLPIGKCCNGNYNPNGYKKFCSLCDKEHFNRKDNICTKCRNENKSMLYKRCQKCGVRKEKNKYFWCMQCINDNPNKKTYNTCNLCNQPKKEDTFKACFTCNNKLKIIKNK